MNKTQLKAKKRRIKDRKDRERRSISGRFGEPNYPKGMARTLEEFEANGGRLFK
jgi:hypothetical protein